VARASTRFGLQRAEVGRMFTAGGQVYIAAGRFADRVLVRAASLAPERTGKLKRSLRKLARMSPMGVTFLVGSDLDYAEMVHDGTKAHVIRPRNGRVLAFQIDGRKAFARSVNHPGSKGSPFLRRALVEETLRGL
jgi:hypothetical protein